MPSALATQYNRDIERLRRRLIDRMSRRAESYLRRLAREAVAAHRAGGDAVAAINEADRQLLALLTPQYTAAVVGVRRILSARYGMAAEIPMQPILDAAGQRIVTVNGTARDVVRRQLRDAIRLNLSDAETERLIRGAVGDTYRAERIARTESAFATNEATAQAYEAEGIDRVEVFDGASCGWTSHDDPLKAHGRVVSVAAARRQPIAHPNCQRAFAPLV